VFGNFVLSYVDDPSRFLGFVAKVLKPGGSCYLTDVHPETAMTLKWKRGVRMEDGFKEIQAYHRPIAEIVAQCEEAGLQACLCLEPKFGSQERDIFEQNGKMAYFEEIAEHPAIYALRLTANKKQSMCGVVKTEPTQVTTLLGARFAFTPTASVAGELCIHQGRVKSIVAGASLQRNSTRELPIDLDGYLILPGLINAHDHLDFALFPRLGAGGYKNFLEWADDIHRSCASKIAQHREVPKDVRLWWGGIRNILCGVTTVCHHNPYEPKVFSNDFIVRVLRDYGWSHSLALDSRTGQRKKETPEGRKFFIHLAEGIDEQSREEVFKLEQEGALDADTVVIHGLGMGPRGSALLQAAGAGLIWCPSSNLFLFGTSMLPDQIRGFPRVALGNDSPLSADGDLLDEIRCAHVLLQTPAVEVYEYVTRRAAELIRLKDGEGSFRVGGMADLVAVQDKGLSPADLLPTLTYRDVELVLLGGRVQLASQQVRNRLPTSVSAGLEALEVEGMLRWVRAPLQYLFNETAARLGSEIYLGGRRVCLGN
jgi:cytosine/adenosine deaminase-related metal-dependent hydrolase